MNYANTGTRILLGLLFFVFGLNGFLQFLPQPPLNETALAFLGQLLSSKLLIVVKALEVVSGALLLSGFFVPLALFILAPISFNIFWFHFAYDPGGLMISFVILALVGFQIFSNKNVFGLFLRPKN